MTVPSVTKEMTQRADRQVRELGARRAMVKLSEAEPALIDYVERGMERIWRKLRGYGLIGGRGPKRIDATLYPTILRVIVSSLEAQRLAQRALAAEQRKRPSYPIDEDDFRRMKAELLENVEGAYWPVGRDRAMRELHASEPELHRFIRGVHGAVLDALADHPVPEPVREVVSEQIVLMGVICCYASQGPHLD